MAAPGGEQSGELSPDIYDNNEHTYLVQKKRLSITHSFGSEHSDSSDGLLCGAMDSPPRTPGLGLLASDKDRSSTPLSSGSEERQFVVKVTQVI